MKKVFYWFGGILLMGLSVSALYFCIKVAPEFKNNLQEIKAIEQRIKDIKTENANSTVEKQKVEVMNKEKEYIVNSKENADKLFLERFYNTIDNPDTKKEMQSFVDGFIK